MTAKPTFPALPAETRRSQVAAALREAILDGRLAPDTAVTETLLARELGVSRGPVREALRELIDSGLLVQRPYAGTRVARLDRKAILDAYALRGELEAYAFRLAWPRRDAAFHASLAERHRALKAAIAAGRRDLEIEAELALHALAYEYADNAPLLRAWRQLADTLLLGFVAYRAQPLPRGHRSAHDRLVALAGGRSLAALLKELRAHIALGQARVGALFAGPPPRARTRRVPGAQFDGG